MVDIIFIRVMLHMQNVSETGTYNPRGTRSFVISTLTTTKRHYLAHKILYVLPKGCAFCLLGGA